MLYHVEPQPRNSRQELQEIEADPPGGYGFVSSPQISYSQGHLGHPPIVFPGYYLFVYEAPQNLARNGDRSDFAEAEPSIENRSPSTPPSYLEENLGWQQEADAQPFHNLPGKQIWDGVGLSLYLQISHYDESDIAGSEQSSLEGYCPSAAGSLPQPPHEASYGNLDLELYQSTPGSFPDRNWGTQQPSRYHTENSPSSISRDTPPTQLLASRGSNYRPLQNYRYIQQGDQQDIKPLKRRRSSTCAECDTPFERAGDLQRHLDTAKVHGLAKGPSCPIGGCKYLNKRFTRVDNFKAHLVKRHGVGAGEATRLIRKWKEGGRPDGCSPKASGRGNGN